MNTKNLIYLFAIAVFFAACNPDDPEDNQDPNINIAIPDGFNQASYSSDFHIVYGGNGNNDDELVSGMVADNSGNSYFSVNSNKDIIIGKVNTDGTLGWAKKWDGNYTDRTPDSGENAETGGTANSISIDSEGNIYVVAAASDVSQNNIFSALILKINSSNGEIIWQKKWKHEWNEEGSSVLAYMDAQPYGVDAEGDYVYVTGADGRNRIFLLALNKNDGTIFTQNTLDIVSGTKDRGYVVKHDQNGNVFIGGVTGSYPYLSKINGANTATPILEWTKKIDLGYGSRINGIDIDNNEIYLSCDRRGAQTYFSVIKLTNDGSQVWGKTYPAKNEDRNNTHTVSVAGDYVYVGGRIGVEDLDTFYGDGLLLKLNKSDGSKIWGGIYYSGSSDEEKAEHRIKGIAVVGSEVYVAGQVYSGNDNYEHFYGEWIAAENTLEDYQAVISDLTAFEFASIETGEVRDAEGSYTAPASNFVLQNATDKKDATPPDGDFFLTKISID